MQFTCSGERQVAVDAPGERLDKVGGGRRPWGEDEGRETDVEVDAGSHVGDGAACL